jgi:antitoxin component of MazEF toxin-antitoxin module
MCPLVKRIIDVGKTSKGVILPKSWLSLLECKYGKIETVSMEVNGKLVIRPIFRKREGLENGDISE